jgi:hypothetical protein
MIKVPGTPAGIPAIKTLIGEDVNMNVTLMFSVAYYDGVAAFARAFESLMASIAKKREQWLAGWQRRWASLGSAQGPVEAALARLLSDSEWYTRE